MGNAALAYTTPESRFANDNRPPDKKVDRWRLLIDGFTRIRPSLGVFVAQERARRVDVDAFIAHNIEGIGERGRLEGAPGYGPVTFVALLGAG